MIKAIFFDVANTLLQKSALVPNIQATLREHGYTIEAKEIQLEHQKLTERVVFPDTTNKQFYEQFNSDLCEALGVEPAQELIDAIYSQNRGLNWTPFEDTSCLNLLEVPLGIGSNWDSTLRAKLTQYFTIDFNWILVSEELGIKKPNASFFSKMIEVSGHEANEIMFVGDSMRLDILPAIDIGIQAVLIDRTDFYTSYNGKKVDNLNDLSRWI